MIDQRVHVSRIAWAWLCAGLWLGCGGGGHRVLLPEPGQDPPAIRDACSRAEIRCSSCHTVERILTAQYRGRDEWARQVERMRLKPASTITLTDVDAIMTCLLYLDTQRAAPAGL